MQTLQIRDSISSTDSDNHLNNKRKLYVGKNYLDVDFNHMAGWPHRNCR